MNKALLPTAVLLALLQGACKSSEQYGDGRYAHCVDLGELAVQSRSGSDAEDRMRVQVAGIGGDTLLFGVRGRAEQLNETPTEIVARRDVVMERTPTVTFEQAASPDGERPLPVLPTAQNTDEELWYYGAALRCKAAGVE